MNENRGHWYLLTGLLIGLVLGLVYGWVIQPTQQVDVDPSALNPTDVAAYRLLVAQAYLADGDLVRAEARLALLGDENIVHVLEQQARIMQTKMGQEENAKALARLAADLQQKQ